MVVAAALFPDLEGHWLPSYRSDPRATALYRRHYSAEKNARVGKVVRNCVGPGEPMVLLTADGAAVFIWLHNTITRWDRQDGICCTIFRNEGPVLSSELIREACALAWARWPGRRLWTYVWDAKVASVNPGYCFKRAGWRVCGRNADGRLTILEILPPQQEDAYRAPDPAAPMTARGCAADSHDPDCSGQGRWSRTELNTPSPRIRPSLTADKETRPGR